MIFLGLWSQHATYDKSIIVCCLRTLVQTGKTRIWRTRDWRRPPGPPKFPLQDLSNQLQAIKFGKNVCQLTDIEYEEALSDLGSGKPSSIRWMTQFSDDIIFGEPGDDVADGNFESIELFEEREDCNDNSDGDGELGGPTSGADGDAEILL